MLTFEQMLWRLLVAMILGALIGVEREAVGKDAGIRTSMLVAAGASLFTMISLMMPEVLGIDTTKLPILSDRVVSNIVVGIGFLGGGIIIKSGEHVRGLTTAALVWTVAAIGVLVGLGLTKFAVTAGFIIAAALYILRKMKLYEYIRPGSKVHHNENNGE